MTEGHKALRDDVLGAIDYCAFYESVLTEHYDGPEIERISGILTDAVMPVVVRELAARDAVIGQIRALAEAWRQMSTVRIQPQTEWQQGNSAGVEHTLDYCADDLARIFEAAIADGGSFAGVHRIGKKRAGRELDGRTWDEYPVGVA